MIGKLIKRILGIEDLENQMSIMANGKADLEAKVIDAENSKALVKSVVERSVAETELVSEANQFLRGLKIQITDENSAAALSGIKAADAVERYGLKRFSPSVERGYNSPVISMEELQAHPEQYMLKLEKGFFNFPIRLNFDKINDILSASFGNLQINTNSSYSNNGTLDFVLSSMLGGCEKNGGTANGIMLKAGELSNLNRSKAHNWMQMDTLDFISNCDGLIKMVYGLSGISEEGKKKAASGFELARFAYLTGLETIGKTRIRKTSELLDYTGNEKPNVITTTEIEKMSAADMLKRSIKIALLSDMDGMSYQDIERLLPLRSKEKFVRLASEITDKILANDRQRRGLTAEINKPLSEYSVGEAVALSAYFARNVITKYKKLEDTIRDIFSGEKSDEVTGKCTDYTALSLYYLREYLIPMQPEKFVNWQFGVENTNIESYRHSYIKAIHINGDLSVDTFTIDPTQLANKGINALKSKKAVINGLDTKNIPVLIRRDAEDLLYAANEKMGEKK